MRERFSQFCVTRSDTISIDYCVFTTGMSGQKLVEVIEQVFLADIEKGVPVLNKANEGSPFDAVDEFMKHYEM